MCCLRLRKLKCTQYWVPILAILCDGVSFEFIVYDSGSKHVYSSDVITGLVDRVGKPQLFALSIKETTEYIFDYFLSYGLYQWPSRLWS
jgi:hypothetical protein